MSGRTQLYNVTQSKTDNDLTNLTGKRRKRQSKRTQATTRGGTAAAASTTMKKEQLLSETGGGGQKETACLRRLKREWKDAVKLGIAYDWMTMTTVGGSNSSSNNNEKDRYSYVRIGPLGKNLLKWHFSVMGPTNSDYEGGIYHGRVLLPKEYPARPPRIQMYTPSGRFICGVDICLSASAFHPESWTPQWTVLSLVDALRIHMLTTALEIGGKNDTPEQRRRYARASRRWHLGRIDHRTMVQDGIFPWHGNDDNESVGQSTESPLPTTAMDIPGDVGVQVTVKRTREMRARANRVRQKSTLPTIFFRAVVEVLTSPVRLAILLFLTLFVMLNNRH